MTQDFSYFVFDRQACTFLNICEMMVDTWDDHTPLELTLDLKSLTMKGARLCALADMDWEQQQCDITFSRREVNDTLLKSYHLFVKDQFAPLMLKVFANTDMLNAAGYTLWHGTTPSPIQLFSILQEKYITNDSREENVTGQFAALIKGLEKAASTDGPEPVFPVASPIQRLWLMIMLFTHLLYMIFHFQRVHNLCEKEIPEEEAGINMQRYIHWYGNTTEGSEELNRYVEALAFSKGRALTIEELKEERKKLLNIVPKVFHRCFMHHIGCMDDFGKAWLHIDATKEENELLVEALAKWELLTKEIEELLHPERIEPELYNNVFNTMLHDRRISMVELREKIGRMLKFVDKKNKWICVWSVLKFHNMLKNQQLHAFASQMMHEDWFGNSQQQTVSADNLTEYSGYFTDTFYTFWNEEDYQRKKKSRWSDSLCTKFKYVCAKMDEAFRGGIFKKSRIREL